MRDVWGGDPMTWMACVLALLVATILLGRIGLGWRHATLIAILTAATMRWPARAHALPPPLSHGSLHQSHVITR